jgi:cell division protein FtsZ
MAAGFYGLMHNPREGETMQFEFVEDQGQKAARIKVIGIGGAGNNAINNMIAAGLSRVGFIAANTDLQALEISNAPRKLQLGADLTKGLGCGADPDRGRQAALENQQQIQDYLKDSDMVFITAGMGGGTGTGGAPVVAELLSQLEHPPLTVAVVTKPFHFEGKKRLKQAEDGIKRLRQYADTIIVIPNNRLIAMAPRGCGLKEAFKMADDVLLQAVKGVSDLILVPGLINLDFADAQTVMAQKGMALMGTGLASGPERATAAAEKAISSPLLDEISIKGAQGILINICCAEDSIALDEVDAACTFIQKEAHEDATVIFGVAWDNTLGDDLRITVIATGISERGREAQHTDTDDLPLRPRRLPTLEEVNQDAREQYTRPAVERRGDSGSAFVPPSPKRLAEEGLIGRKRMRMHDLESIFAGDTEELERPAFMRRQAD